MGFCNLEERKLRKDLFGLSYYYTGVTGKERQTVLT